MTTVLQASQEEHLLQANTYYTRMPVDIDRFEEDDALGASTTSERVIRFLASHDAQAYTRREIADAIDADPETVGTNLTRLKRRGLVRHRGHYWAFTDDRAHARHVLADRYGEAAAASLVGEVDRAHERSNGGDRTARAATVQGPHRRAASAYFDRVRDRLGDAIEGLYLFGSVARDAETPSSDVDVLAVVADEADHATVDDVLLELAYDVQLEHEVRVEVHVLSKSAFDDRRDRGDPFVRTVLAEAEAGG